MPCQKCGLEQQSKFNAEINVHFPGHESRDKASILIFPELLVCLNCGFTELSISKKDLPSLAMGVAK
jgi:hypothetical protein